jgi:(4-O-methyl)-D-glucuronate---lignin esterase
VRRNSAKRLTSACLLLFGCAAAVAAEPSADLLRQEFLSPPQAAEPRVWWHWMNGNVTKSGIRLDLEWMKRIGIGGMNCIDASIETPQVVQQRLVYMSPKWQDAFRYTAQLADKLGLELSIDSSPGWSETGGPWVQPAQAMKKLVWSTTPLEGGRRFAGTLAHPPTTTGPFQNIEYDQGTQRPPDQEAPQFYADAGVLAYPLPVTEQGTPALTITSSAGPLDAALLSDGELQKGVTLPAAADGSAWIQLTYDGPQTIRSAVLGTPLPGNIMAVNSPMMGQLEAQDEQGAWANIATLRITNVPQVTASFKPVTARAFRLKLTAGGARDLPFWPAPGASLALLEAIGWTSPAPRNFIVSEFTLSPIGRVNEFERKAGFAVASDYDVLATAPEAANSPVPPSSVIDLSARLTPDGHLDWTPPPGRWAVLRFGFSLIGKTNSPASREATGLEVDKLNARHVKDYMQKYLGTYSSFLSPSQMGQRGLQSMMLDSTEVGPQNWTDDMLEQFQHLRGYDPHSWLPALTGVIIGSAEQSDRFLWDFRRTIAQLTSIAHYAEVAAAAHAFGLIQYGEALELDRPVLGDDMEMRRYADVPTGAMWTHALDQGPLPSYIADDRGAASVAHLYGRRFAAAESLTSAFAPWAFSPRDLKPFVDLEFVLGVNRIIVHTSVHQPNEKAPGLSLAMFGQFFNRHETWAEQARPWVSYLARSSYLLQQGRFVADVAYFYGEDTPLTILQTQGRLNDTPQHYAFDFVNAEALLNQVSVQDGYLVTPSGMRYRALQLGGDAHRMTVPVLRKILELVSAGALVVGAPPEDSPSLIDDTGEFQRLKNTLWGSDGKGAILGSGRVYGEGSIEEILSLVHLAPDFTYSESNADTALLFAHRTLPAGEIYFLSHRVSHTETVEASFRVTNRIPELWHAETGQIEPVSFHIEQGRTRVSLKLAPYDAVFVVFRRPAREASRELAAPLVESLGTIDGPWTLNFPANLGAPPTFHLTHLQSWTKNSDPGIKYFSGTATYTKIIDAPKSWFARRNTRLVLDLGEVDDLAKIKLNGKSLRILWKPPYRIDVTRALHPGKNALEVQVTNLWVNRLIGDHQPHATPVAFTTFNAYAADAPLLDSGLLGPVELLRLTPRLDLLEGITNDNR